MTDADPCLTVGLVFYFAGIVVGYLLASKWWRKYGIR